MKAFCFRYRIRYARFYEKQPIAVLLLGAFIMATNPQVTDSTATSVKTDTQPGTMDWAVVVETSTNKKTGKEEQSLRSFVFTKETEIAEYKEDGTLVGVQTITFPIPQTFKGIAEVLPDEEQACVCFFNGMKSSLIGPRFRRKLEESKLDDNGQIVALFGFVDGSYDVTELMREDAKRKNLSPQEKIIKNLRGIPGFENLPDAVLLSMYDNMKASLPQSMVDDINSEEVEGEGVAQAV
jgi:hypothetical protein